MAKVKQKDSLGNRMKENYENRSKTKLIRRMPVVIRLDGKAFHSFTRGFDRPFDKCLMETMKETTLELCKNIQGCVFGYTQSDEISLVLVDYNALTTDAWFDYEVQKLCSISASMATLLFNRLFAKKVNKFIKENSGSDSEQVNKLISAYKKAVTRGGLFDSRCFNIPKEEVTNYVYWRELDAKRNSIQSSGQAKFSHKELHQKTCDDIQKMLIDKFNIDWNNYSNSEKIGTAVVKNDEGKWYIDENTPILVGENRAYLDDRITFDD